MTARVSMLLKSRASLTCFRACFLPGWVKNLSAPRYWVYEAWRDVLGTGINWWWAEVYSIYLFIYLYIFTNIVC